MQDVHSGWYLVYTKPRQENIAVLNLQHQGFKTYLPLLKQHKRVRQTYQLVIEPCFPRYLFILLHSGIDDWSKIRSTSGCISLVRFGALPARVPDDLVNYLQQADDKKLNQPTNSTPDFQLGSRVRIIDGILVNYEGIVEAKNNRDRITLLLNISEKHTCQVDLSVNQITWADN